MENDIQKNIVNNLFKKNKIKFLQSEIITNLLKKSITP